MSTPSASKLDAGPALSSATAIDHATADQYAAVTGAAGLVDRSRVGRLKVTGADALDLLNRLSTNRLDDLAVGRGLYTVLTSNKGRIIDLLFVARRDEHLLVLTGPDTRSRVAEWIDFYTFTEDVTVEDLSDADSMLAAVGPSAAEVLEEASGTGLTGLAPYESVQAAISGAEVLVVRTDFARIPGYDLVVAASEEMSIREELLRGGESLGLKPVGDEALEIVRIEQGVPVQGNELNEDANPLEASLLDHISFNKVCYIGQEVVARLNTYDKVQRKLVGVSWNRDATPVEHAPLRFGEAEVGHTTSHARSPRLGRHLALAYVRNAHAEPGTALSMDSTDGPLDVRVEVLPLTPRGTPLRPPPTPVP